MVGYFLMGRFHHPGEKKQNPNCSLNQPPETFPKLNSWFFIQNSNFIPTPRVSLNASMALLVVVDLFRGNGGISCFNGLLHSHWGLFFLVKNMRWWGAFHSSLDKPMTKQSGQSLDDSLKYVLNCFVLYTAWKTQFGWSMCASWDCYVCHRKKRSHPMSGWSWMILFH